ncbi:DUF3267 domain-containing protein [Streptococcus iners]|uniref:DUF3267 domain-containing protein n=1 Tax=Streptococcus iners TaxID=3028084 RepID=A0AA96VYS5_9STRE|nr:DUF3267 domain-containing protein [Streptococcus sp. 29887]MCK4024628.1 DUF3267 domain-containing protein [Streptococcus suis]WNY50385.1 DUF3267 domain-containing protein [Streptococcus sp. 29887]HEL2401704.1 DUF3267 domain-containing protein [Streptococcus suis]
MEAKKKLYEVNIMENKKFVWGLNILSTVLIFPFAHLFGKLAFSLLANVEQNLPLTLPELWIGMVLFPLLIVVHEAIHGIFFKVFCPENPVKYGIKWKSGMAYATSPGSLYNRMQMLVISLAPFVVISLGLTILASLGGMDVSLYLMVATMHAAACAGDFYYTYLLLVKFAKGNIAVEDTETGLIIYQA